MQTTMQTQRMAGSTPRAAAPAPRSAPLFAGLRSTAGMPKRLSGNRVEVAEAAFRRIVARQVGARSTGASSSSFAMNTKQAMNIVFISAEVAPWSKTGAWGGAERQPC